MGRSSSAKKVARLAHKGKGKKVRFQGGSVFPLVIIGVILAGIGLVAYSRATLPSLDAVERENTQVRVAYGFYLCDEFVVLPDTIDPDGTFEQFGVFNLADGVALMQPQGADRTGGPRLGSLLDAYGVQLSDSRLELPDTVEGETVWEEGTTQCDGRSAELTVVTWDDLDDERTDSRSITAFRDIRFPNDGMAVAVVFAPAGTNVPLPDSVEDLRNILSPVAGPVIDFEPVEGDEAGDDGADDEPAEGDESDDDDG